MQESESIMRFFVADVQEDEDLEAPDGSRRKDLFENAPLLNSTSGAGVQRGRKRPESEFGRAKLHPEGIV